MTIAILATGPSMSQAVADGLAGMPRIVVNDAFRLAPDADALCANDGGWWRVNAEALKFQHRRFSCNSVDGVEKVRSTPLIDRNSNSALLALHVAVHYFRAKRVLLYGVDCSAARGQHYFGPHTKTWLRNTDQQGFEKYKRQFADYARTLPDGVEVLNCSPLSELRVFPFAQEVAA